MLNYRALLATLAVAALSQTGITFINTTNAPVRAIGSFGAATFVATAGQPAGKQTDDLLVGFVVTANETAPTVSGWTAIPGASVSQGSSCPSTSCVRVDGFYRIATGSDAFTTNDSGDHQYVRMFAVTVGTYNTTTPFDTVTTNTQASTTAISITGFTPANRHCLIVAVSGAGEPDLNSTTEFSIDSAGNTIYGAERADNTSSTGSGGGLWIYTGQLHDTGPTGTFTATAQNTSVRSNMMLCINPA